MRIGIVDADLLGRDKHRFPNLVCEKLAGYWKDQGATVTLITDREYTWLQVDVFALDIPKITDFDMIYVCKVFTDTPVPEYLQTLVNTDGHCTIQGTDIYIGGTGFYFDKAPNLPEEIEHHIPDYSLYDEWIADEVSNARKKAEESGRSFNESSFMVQFKEYTDYSIGFTTRGCFRKCPFCVNQKYDHVFVHSPLDEFYDPDRKKICLLDDNILGCPQWKTILNSLIATGKPFKFKQGMDERLLTDEKCEILFSANYDGDYTFAFDNIADYKLIHRKLHLIRKYTSATTIKFYVLVAFESTDHTDIENAFKRIALLMQYRCLPYVMRYQNKNDTPWKRSEFRELYITMARWCNQPSFFKKMSFREFCEANQLRIKTEGTYCTAMRALTDFESKHPEIARQYFDLHFPAQVMDDWEDVVQ